MINIMYLEQYLAHDKCYINIYYVQMNKCGAGMPPVGLQNQSFIPWTLVLRECLPRVILELFCYSQTLHPVYLLPAAIRTCAI